MAWPRPPTGERPLCRRCEGCRCLQPRGWRPGAAPCSALCCGYVSDARCINVICVFASREMLRTLLSFPFFVQSHLMGGLSIKAMAQKGLVCFWGGGMSQKGRRALAVVLEDVGGGAVTVLHRTEGLGPAPHSQMMAEGPAASALVAAWRPSSPRTPEGPRRAYLRPISH